MENSSDDFKNVWVKFPDSCNGLYQVYIYILWISLIEFVAHKWAGAHIYTQGPYNAKLWLPWRPHRRSSSHATVWLLERRKSLKERILVAYMENYSRIIAWLATKHTHSYIQTKSWFLTRHAKSTTHAYSCFSLITTMYLHMLHIAVAKMCPKISKKLTMLQSWAKS